LSKIVLPARALSEIQDCIGNERFLELFREIEFLPDLFEAIGIVWEGSRLDDCFHFFLIQLELFRKLPGQFFVTTGNHWIGHDFLGQRFESILKSRKGFWLSGRA